MNPFIWTPRYLWNRTRLFFYEKNHKNEPWIPAPAVRALEGMLDDKMSGLEFGSGRSTVWYANRLNHLVSIEDHKEWYNEVQKQLEAGGVSNVDYVFKSSQTNENSRSDYCTYIDSFDNESLDFIVVDGKHRDTLANKATQKLVAGGILLLDDSERYLAYASRAPYAIGPELSKMAPSWKLFYEQVGSWEAQTYTNGISDTTIFIKP